MNFEFLKLFIISGNNLLKSKIYLKFEMEKIVFVPNFN